MDEDAVVDDGETCLAGDLSGLVENIKISPLRFPREIVGLSCCHGEFH